MQSCATQTWQVPPGDSDEHSDEQLHMRKLPCNVVMGSQALGAERCQDLQCLSLANRTMAAAILLMHGQQYLYCICAVKHNLDRCRLYCCCHLHVCLLCGMHASCSFCLQIEVSRQARTAGHARRSDLLRGHLSNMASVFAVTCLSRCSSCLRLSKRAWLSASSAAPLSCSASARDLPSNVNFAFESKKKL